MTSFLTTPIHPYAYDGLALLLILFFLWRGWRRGLVRELSSVISIGGSILLAKPLGNLLLKIPGIALPEFLTSIVGPAIGGIAAYILLRFSCFVIAKSTGLLKKREEGEEVINSISWGVKRTETKFEVKSYCLLATPLTKNFFERYPF